MFIPRYWSEASHKEEFPGRKQATIRRFGWSSTSQADADVHARLRVEEALAAFRAGGPEALETFTRRERAVAYSGADGLPIREEIVLEREDADVVVTRNSYGALCMNTRLAMFVDVDAPETRANTAGCVGGLVGFAAGALAGAFLFDVGWLVGALIGGVVSAVATHLLARASESMDPRARDIVRWTIDRTREWCATRPDWRVAVYRTPAGARLLPLHAAFDAGEGATYEFMDFVRADPLYQRMCRLQKCFRARVSPKPWRAGVRDHFKAGGTWPVRDPGKLAHRAEWVRRYEQAARGYASCLLVDVLGGGREDPRIASIRRIHDDLCGALSQRPLA